MKSPAKKKTAPVKSAKSPVTKPASKKKAPAKRSATRVATARPAKPAPKRSAPVAARKAPTNQARVTALPAPAAKGPVKSIAKPAAPVVKPAVKATAPTPTPTPAVRGTSLPTRPPSQASKPPETKGKATPAEPAATVKPAAAKAVVPIATVPVTSASKPAGPKSAIAVPTVATGAPAKRAGRKVPTPPPARAKSPVRPVVKPVKALVDLPAMAKPGKKSLTLKIPALLLEGDHEPGPYPGGPGSRYALGLSPASASAVPDEPVLPAYYGTKKIWLVPRDPQWLYAHWDFDDDQQREYNQLSRDGHLILRVYDAAETAEALTEIHVHPESRSWFAHVGRGGGRYFSVLGFRDRTGEWNEITRSGAVGTPPDSLSEEVEAEFITLPYAIEPAEPPEAGAATPAPLPPGAPPPVATLAEVIEVVREYIAGEPALAEAIEEARATDHLQWPAPIELPPPAEFVHWTPEQREALAKVISMDAVRQVWAGSHPSSVTLAQISAEQRQKDLASAAAIPALEAGARTGPGGGAISSPPGGQPKPRSFWFDVNAELIIYGATEPNATVVIGDRPIKLRTDGTFSYRFALPDGLYGLPVSATSADRVETRHASLTFMRETEYGGEVGTHPQDAALKTPGPEHTS